MKNSIEEDIKDIEKYISFTSKRENFSHDTDWNWNKDLANKIEHILSDYKRVLKENEELNEKILDNAGIYQLGFKDGEESYIKKVKDKIEEYKNMLKTCNKVKDIDRIKAINERILELEELLEGRK